MICVRLVLRLEHGLVRRLRLGHARLEAVERRRLSAAPLVAILVPVPVVGPLPLATIGLGYRRRSNIIARRPLRAHGRRGKIDRIDLVRFFARFLATFPSAFFRREPSLGRGPPQGMPRRCGIFRDKRLLARGRGRPYRRFGGRRLHGWRRLRGWCGPWRRRRPRRGRQWRLRPSRRLRSRLLRRRRIDVASRRRRLLVEIASAPGFGALNRPRLNGTFGRLALDGTFGRLGLDGADFRRGWRLTRGLDEFARGFSLHLANRFFEREALAGDVGFIERGGEPAQLRKQSRARTFVERTAILAVVLFETGDGACNERVIIGHRSSAYFHRIML